MARYMPYLTTAFVEYKGFGTGPSSKILRNQFLEEAAGVVLPL